MRWTKLAVVGLLGCVAALARAQEKPPAIKLERIVKGLRPLTYLADDGAGRLFVDAVHEDAPFTSAMTRAVDAEIAALAQWLGLTLQR